MRVLRSAAPAVSNTDSLDAAGRCYRRSLILLFSHQVLICKKNPKKLIYLRVVSCPLNREELRWKEAVALEHHPGLRFLFSSSENDLPRIWNSNKVQSNNERLQGTSLCKTKTTHAQVSKWRGTPQSSAIWWASRGQHRVQWKRLELRWGDNNS